MAVLTLTTDEAKGSVTGGGSYDAGTSVTIKATANDGYSFMAWLDNDGRVFWSADSYTFTINEDMTLQALFMSDVANVDIYAYCDANCKHKVLNVGQIVHLFQELYANGGQVPSGFANATAVNEIIDQNTGQALRLFVGTQEQYDNWNGNKKNLFAIISDDKTLQEILARLVALESSVTGIIDGTTRIPKASHSLNADNGVTCSDGTFTNLTYSANNGCLKLGESNTFIEHKQLIHYGEVSTTVNEDGKTVTPIVIDVPSQAGELKVGDWLEFELRANLDSNYTRQTIMIDELRSYPVYRNLIVQGCASNGTFQFRSIGISLTSTQIQILHNYPTDSLLDLQPVYLLRVVKIVGAAL